MFALNRKDVNYMRQVIVNNTPYTAVGIDVDILLTDDNLVILYENFRMAKHDRTFDGSFSEYCKFCFVTGAGLYLLEASRIQDSGKHAVIVHENSDKGGFILYGN